MKRCGREGVGGVRKENAVINEHTKSAYPAFLLGTPTFQSPRILLAFVSISKIRGRTILSHGQEKFGTREAGSRRANVGSFTHRLLCDQ